jgi:hypothetical protein
MGRLGLRTALCACLPLGSTHSKSAKIDQISPEEIGIRTHFPFCFIRRFSFQQSWHVHVLERRERRGKTCHVLTFIRSNDHMTIGYSCTRVLRHDGDSASVATLGTTHHHPVIKWYILWTHKQPIGGTGILDHPPHPVGACVPLRTRPRLAAAKRGLSCWENKDEAWFFLIDVEREAIRPYRSLSLSCGTVLGSPQQRPWLVVVVVAETRTPPRLHPCAARGR